MVQRMLYFGLPDHSSHELAARQQRRCGEVLAFNLAGGGEAAWLFIDTTVLMSLTANLGGAKTSAFILLRPPMVGCLSKSGKRRVLISNQSVVRVTVGLEDIEDLPADC